jgi:hypothetical protein
VRDFVIREIFDIQFICILHLTLYTQQKYDAADQPLSWSMHQLPFNNAPFLFAIPAIVLSPSGGIQIRKTSTHHSTPSKTRNSSTNEQYKRMKEKKADKE